jgi:hypothetical protein
MKRVHIIFQADKANAPYAVVIKSQDRFLRDITTQEAEFSNWMEAKPFADALDARLYAEQGFAGMSKGAFYSSYEEWKLLTAQNVKRMWTEQGLSSATWEEHETILCAAQRAATRQLVAAGKDDNSPSDPLFTFLDAPSAILVDPQAVVDDEMAKRYLMEE